MTRKTFRLKLGRQGGVVGGSDYDKWCDSWGGNFSGQEVTITVETVEPEKPKVRMCGSYLDDDFDKECDKPAQWEIVDDGHKHYRCNEHIWRILHGFRKQYTISPIPPEPPQPPEPFVVDKEWDFRNSYRDVISVPEELRNKQFTVHFKEKVTT